MKDTLPLPEGDIPVEGRSDPRPTSFGLSHWQDLFNSRQLLCLGKLMQAILKIEDKGIREILIATLSDSVNANNMLCKYESNKLHSVPLFGHHAFWVPDMPVENNTWGAKFGRGTFQACFRKTKRAILWTKSPEEKIEGGKTKVGDSPDTEVTQDSSTIPDGKERCALFNRTAEDLSFLPEESVDCVVTDPPYYGNVMYAELSDFFYSWLRVGLKDTYPVFSSLTVPKSREIVVNKKARVGNCEKDDTFFRQGIRRSFSECHRVLKEKGQLIFTFHHEEPEAWAAVLDAVLESGFDIQRVWTTRSEGRSGFHAGGIRFDTIIVARKRSGEPTEASWRVLQDEIAAEVQAELKRLLENGAKMSMEDVFVVTIGKALAVYSRHYPLVMRKGKKVILKDAIKDIEGLVNEQIDAYFGLVVPHWLDVVSRIYLQVFAHRKVVTRDQLVKMSSYAGVSFTELEEQELMKRSKKAGVYEVLTPAQREKYLEKIYESKAMTMIDRAHWLYLAYSEGKSLRQVIPKVYEDQLEEVLDAFSAITRDETYKKIAQNVEKLKDKGALF